LFLQIYCPVFFSGEWIVACFMISTTNQIHICCHKGSFDEVKPFCLSLGGIVSKAVKKRGYQEEEFSSTKLAYTDSTIKANDSAFASMFFIENIKTSGEKHLKKLNCKEYEVC